MLTKPTPTKGYRVPSVVITSIDKLKEHKSLKNFELDDMSLEALESMIHGE